MAEKIRKVKVLTKESSPTSLPGSKRRMFEPSDDSEDAEPKELT